MISKIFINFFPKKKLDPHIVPHIVKICGGKCVVGSHQPFLININYHKIPLRIFLGRPTYCQNMQFKICGRSRSDLKMSNNKHLLLQRPFLININYHKIPLRIFLGDIKNIDSVFAPHPHLHILGYHLK